jgi:hypothetical protein
MMTSSPSAIPAAWTQRCKPAVPLLTATACRVHIGCEGVLERIEKRAAAERRARQRLHHQFNVFRLDIRG